MKKLNSFFLRPQQNSSIFLLLLVGLATHGHLLFNDVRVGDDWMYLMWMENGDWLTFSTFHSHYNNFLQAAPLWPLTYFKNVISALHVFSLLIIIASGMVVYRISVFINILSRIESLMLASMSICLPAFMWHASAIYSVFYNLSVIIFYVAVYFALLSETRSGWKKYFMQFFSIILYLYSFHTGSLLVFFFAAALVHCYFLATIRSLNFQQGITYFLSKRCYFLILPIAFRLGYQLYQPYVTNKIGFDPSIYLIGIGQFLQTIYLQLKSVISEIVFIWVGSGSLFALVIVQFFQSKKLGFVVEKNACKPYHALKTLCFGLIFLMLGIFGYVATGKTPSPDTTLGYSTRTLLLAQVPIAFMLILFFRTLSFSAFSKLLVVPIFAGLIGGSVVIQNREGMNWLYFGVLNAAFKLKLSEMPGAKDITYLQVADKSYFMGNTHHPFASLPFAIAQIFHGPSHVFGELIYITDIELAKLPQKNLSSLVSEYFQGDGRSLINEWQLVLPTEIKQGLLVVCPGSTFNSSSRLQLITQYNYYRLFRPGELPQLLSSLLHLHLITTTPSLSVPPSKEIITCESLNTKISVFNLKAPISHKAEI